MVKLCQSRLKGVAEAHPLKGLIEEAGREAAELEVRRENGGGRLYEGGGVPLWLLKGGHPRLVRQLLCQPRQCLSLPSLGNAAIISANHWVDGKPMSFLWNGG